MDEEEKRLAKVKALRDTKVKRSAQPIVPQRAPVAISAAAEAAVASEPAAAVAAPAAAEPEAAVEPVAAAV
jgi:small subunit ribosomal protein S6